ncbi:hypothetical protein G9Q11_28780, partial [Klebsiella pneumoniae]
AIKTKALSEAKAINAVALKKADEAEKQGFQRGIDQLEQLPWWKKMAAFVSSAVRERDKLRTDVETLKKKSKTWREKAENYFIWGKKYAADSKDLGAKLTNTEAELKALKPKAEEAVRLATKNQLLEDKLSHAEGKIQHLDATLEHYQAAEQQAVEAQRLQ